MVESGIIRKMDEFNQVQIPKIIREKMELCPNSKFEIFYDTREKIISFKLLEESREGF